MFRSFKLFVFFVSVACLETSYLEVKCMTTTVKRNILAILCPTQATKQVKIQMSFTFTFASFHKLFKLIHRLVLR